MIKTLSILALFVSAFAINGYCCINEYHARLDGSIVYEDADWGGGISGNYMNPDKLALALKKTDSLYMVTGDIQYYSDHGVYLIYGGKYDEARRIFLEIENKSPALYATAANLGTAYELLGMNDSALHWIKRSVEIDPNSHEGSEWIHVKILEAKIASKDDPNYFRSHSILGIDLGDDRVPVNKNNIDIVKIAGQIRYQLQERMTFVKPPDPVVAQLLFDYGSLTAMNDNVKSAIRVYEQARKYGYTGELVDKREEHFRDLQETADNKTVFEKWAKENFVLLLILAGSAFIAFVTGAIWLFKRWKRKRKARAM
jgi:tetratricopeptide (TPR) repeat protein